MNKFYQFVLQKFPDGIELAFAYGSGVFQQSNNNLAKDNMVDLFFIVKNPASWHKSNLEKHPDHYSFLSYFGPDAITKIQCDYGSRIYFNTLVRFEERLIKYGVLSVEDFLDDVTNWNNLYVSGRLHKPVLQLKNFQADPFREILKGNLESAVNTALLLLPEKFPEQDLFLTIAGLSYTGDFRMTFGEDKNKIKNIVIPNIDAFKSLYKNTINKSRIQVSKEEICIQDVTTEHRKILLNSLPLTVKSNLRKFLSPPEGTNFSSMAEELSFDNEKCSKLLQDSVSSVVVKSSITQSLKGILTAGLSKSVIYSSAKIRKMAKSILR